MFDLRLQWPFSMILVGPTSSGKSTLLNKILSSKKNLFTQQPEKIRLYFNVWQPVYGQMVSSGVLTDCVEGIPNQEDLISFQKSSQCSLVIFDDLAEVLTTVISNLFTVGCHHFNTSCILISQNLFQRSSIWRVCSLNATYILPLKNPRDPSQLGVLSRQTFPGFKNFLPKIFNEQCTSPHSYLVLDFHQRCNPLFKVRSSLFGTSIKCFSPDKCKMSGYKCMVLLNDLVYKNLMELQERQNQNSDLNNNHNQNINNTNLQIHHGTNSQPVLSDNKQPTELSQPSILPVYSKSQDSPPMEIDENKYDKFSETDSDNNLGTTIETTTQTFNPLTSDASNQVQPQTTNVATSAFVNTKDDTSQTSTKKGKDSGIQTMKKKYIAKPYIKQEKKNARQDNTSSVDKKEFKSSIDHLTPSIDIAPAPTSLPPPITPNTLSLPPPITPIPVSLSTPIRPSTNVIRSLPPPITRPSLPPPITRQALPPPITRPALPPPITRPALPPPITRPALLWDGAPELTVNFPPPNTKKKSSSIKKENKEIKKDIKKEIKKEIQDTINTKDHEVVKSNKRPSPFADSKRKKQKTEIAGKRKSAQRSSIYYSPKPKKLKNVRAKISVLKPSQINRDWDSSSSSSDDDF